MDVSLVKLTPYLGKKIKAFGDFEVTFSGGEKVIIKGVYLGFWKDTFVLNLPKIPTQDKKKPKYTPFFFLGYDLKKEFIEKAKHEVVSKCPVVNWDKGIWKSPITDMS